MPDSHLSHRASKVLRALLREYRRRAKSSDSPRPDREFGSSTQIRDRFFPRWSVAAVDAACTELARAGLLSVLTSARAFWSPLSPPPQSPPPALLCSRSKKSLTFSAPSGVFSPGSYRMAARITSSPIMAATIQTGDSTQTQGHVIFPASFKPINTAVSRPTKLTPPVPLLCIFTRSFLMHTLLCSRHNIPYMRHNVNIFFVPEAHFLLTSLKILL